MIWKGVEKGMVVDGLGKDEVRLGKGEERLVKGDERLGKD